MGKELRIRLDIYLPIKENETIEKAINRLYFILDNLEEISYQEYETEVQ